MLSFSCYKLLNQSNQMTTDSERSRFIALSLVSVARERKGRYRHRSRRKREVGTFWNSSLVPFFIFFLKKIFVAFFSFLPYITPPPFMCRPHLLLLQQLCSALFVFQFLSLSAEADSKNEKKNCVCFPLKWYDTIQY